MYGKKVRVKQLTGLTTKPKDKNRSKVSFCKKIGRVHGKHEYAPLDPSDLDIQIVVHIDSTNGKLLGLYAFSSKELINLRILKTDKQIGQMSMDLNPFETTAKQNLRNGFYIRCRNGVLSSDGAERLKNLLLIN